MSVELLGFTSNALMPSIARDIWGMGPEGLGVLDAFSSAGGIIAIALVSMLGQSDRQGVRFIIVLHVFGIALLLLGLAPSVHIAILAIVVMSGMMALSDLFSQTLLQRLVPNDLRGRAMGAWTTAVGTAPLGNLEIGALASILGVTTAISLHGGALILLAIVTFVTFKNLRKI
jgi:sugar phosphate permease